MRPLKALAQSAIATVHRAAARKALPSRLAIYFHELEAAQREAFRAAIGALRELGYATVGPDAYLAPDDGGKRLFVSFDDNYRSWHESRRLLDETGVRATFYVNTLPFRDRCRADEIAAYFDRIRFTGERVTLSVAELAALAADGHVIGCHAHAHHLLSALPRPAWQAEIEASKSLLEDMLGTEVAHFAWPYGMRRCFSPDLHAYCRSLGFRSVAAAIPAMQHRGIEGGDLIHRSGWRLGDPVSRNLADLAVDGRCFERLTGRSAIG